MLGGLVEKVDGGLDAPAAGDMNARAVLEAVGSARGAGRCSVLLGLIDEDEGLGIDGDACRFERVV